MTDLSSLLPFAFTIFAYVVCIKLAARLFRRTQLSWKHALFFGVLLFVLLFVVGALVRRLNPVPGPVLAAVVYLAVDLAAQLAVGGWFLGARARTTAGAPVGLKGGALLSLIAYGLVFVLSLAAAAAPPIFHRMAGMGVS
jgi:hypothetical protein